MSDKRIEETEYKCVVCDNFLRKELEEVCRVPNELAIIGPGGEGQWYTKEELFCFECGLYYRQPPKQDDKKEEAGKEKT